MNPIQAAAEEVRRYDIGVAGDMVLHPQGDWIRYEDYQSALRRAEDAERDCTALQVALDQTRKESTRHALEMGKQVKKARDQVASSEQARERAEAERDEAARKAGFAEYQLKELQDLLRVAQGGIAHDLIVHSFGGMCPTQADGVIYGHSFYFRARHGDWELTVAPSGEDPVCHRAPLYAAEGDDDTHGDMPYATFLRIIGLHMQKIRACISTSPKDDGHE